MGSSKYSDNYESEEYTVHKCICRPFRLIGLICLLVALIFCVLALVSEWWAHSKHDVYSQGLWSNCRKYRESSYVKRTDGSRDYETADRDVCGDIDPKSAWLKSVIALVFLCGIITIFAIIAIIVSLCINSQTAANIAGCFSIAALISMLIALLVFVIKFSQVFEHIDLRLNPEDDYYTQERRWYFGWGYGCGWACCILLCGAACLFLLCKIQDEIYEAEKTYKVDKNEKQTDAL